MTGAAEGVAEHLHAASMRPRLIAVDDRILVADGQLGIAASMRPRLIAVDDWVPALLPKAQPYASMRPRLIAVDDEAGPYTSRVVLKLQ